MAVLYGENIVLINEDGTLQAPVPGTYTVTLHPTFTWVTAPSAGNILTVSRGGSFKSGATVRVTNNTGTYVVLASTATTITLDAAASVSAGDIVAIELNETGGEARATTYKAPNEQVSSAAIVAGGGPYFRAFVKPGTYARLVRDASGDTVLLDLVYLGRGEVAVSPEATSSSGGILEHLDLLPSTGGTLYLGAGTFSCTEQVLVALSTLTIQGAGRGITIVRLANGAADANFTELTGFITLANGVTDVIFRDLTIDGNVANQVRDTYDNLYMTGQNDRIRLLNVGIVNAARDGVHFEPGATPSTEARIEDCYVSQCGRRGLDLQWATGFNIVDNYVEGTGHDGIAVRAGGSQTVNFSADGVIARNVIDRTVVCANVFSAGVEDGRCVNYGGGSENVSVFANIVKGRTGVNQDEAIGSDHEGGDKVWRNVHIYANHVDGAGTDGIMPPVNGNTYGNYIYRPGRHGINFDATTVDLRAGDTVDNMTIKGNIVQDTDESAAGSTRGIRINFVIAAGAMASVNAEILANSVKDSRARTVHSLWLDKSAATVAAITVDANDLLDGGTTNAMHLNSAGFATNLTLLASADQQLTNESTGGGVTNPGLRGVVTLVGGTKPTAAFAWIPATVPARFRLTRLDLNGGTCGVLTYAYNTGTRILTITSADAAGAPVGGDVSIVLWEYLGVF